MKSRSLSLSFSYTLCALATAAVALTPLPRTVWILLGIATAGGALWDRTGAHRIPNGLLTLVGLAGFFTSLTPLHRETLAEQALAALAFLMAVKILGVKARRDHLQILAMSMLLIAGAASLEPSLALGALLAGTLLLGVLLLLWLPFSELTATVDRGLLLRLSLIGLGLTAAAVPITVTLFVVLPRSGNPFWIGLAGRRARGVSGISDHLALGEVSRVALSGELAFRAEIEDGKPLAGIPYWRGAALEVTDGRRWDVSGRTRPPSTAAAGNAKVITYYLEPHGDRQLFLLETPSAASLGTRTLSLGAARVLRLPLPLARRIRYQGRSVPADRFPEVLTPQERSLNLRLPATLPGSIRSLAVAVAGDAGEPLIVATRLMAHFSRGYTYSLQVPETADDPLEAFLLGHRTGYCEYFASGLAVLLRAAGIPARVIGGYLGGDWVPAGGYYLVTQASAHAWVEAYLGGEWVRFDPTPTTSELGQTYAAGRRRRPRLWLDALRMRWNSWVVQYDAESQIALARTGAARMRDLRLDALDTARTAAAALVAAALFWAGITLLGRRGRPPLGARTVRFERLAAHCGAGRRPDEGPLDHAARFALLAPRAGAAVRRFGAVAAAGRYGKRQVDAAKLRELDALLETIGKAVRGGDRSCAPSSQPLE